MSKAEPVIVWIDGLPIWDATLTVLEERPGRVTVLSRRKVRLSQDPKVRSVVFGEDREATYLWVNQRLRSIDVMVTRDPKMANLALRIGAVVLAPEGHRVEEDENANAIKANDFLRELESFGAATGGHLPLNDRDKARYTLVLEEVLDSKVPPEPPKAKPDLEPSS